MLDFDLAALYEVPTKVLKQSVKRNINRFPDDFMFELSKNEWLELVTICDHIPDVMKHSYVPPFAFTEHGVTMLSSILRSDIAVNISIQIVRAFIALRQLVKTSMEMRQLAVENAEIRAKLELLERSDESILESVNDLSESTRRDVNLLYDAMSDLAAKVTEPPQPPRRPIGYKTGWSGED
jgi:replicative DNA helicase